MSDPAAQISDREWVERGRLIYETSVRVGHLETAVDKLSVTVEKQVDRLEASISSSYTRLETQIREDRTKQQATQQKVNVAFGVVIVLAAIASNVLQVFGPIFRK